MRLFTSLAVACLSMAAAAVPAGAQGMFNVTDTFDFCDERAYFDNFVEVRRGPQIGPAAGDLGKTGHCALNFTGSAGSAGDTWITRYDGGSTSCLGACVTAIGGPIFTTDHLCLSADILSARFDNAKGGGVVALLGATGGPGLFVQIVNSGNSDRVTINTVDPATGKITVLASQGLGSAVAEKAWLRLSVFIHEVPGGLSVQGFVHAHKTPSDPNSDLASFLPLTIVGVTIPSLEALGLSSEGYVGVGGWAKSATIDTSVTNFQANQPCS